MSAANRAPDLSTIGGRLRVERLRFDMSQTVAANLAGFTRRAWCSWEAGEALPATAALVALSTLGADVRFIIAGSRRQSEQAALEPLAGLTVRQALAMLDPVDRHRLLLDLLADELAA